MKKIILITSIFLFGFTNAKSSEIKTSETKIFCLKKTFELTTYRYFSTCGVNAVTYQPSNWSHQDKMQWIKAIEQNYCSQNAPFSNNSGIY